MGVGTTNKRVDRATKLMGAISKIFVHRATLVYAMMVDSGVRCYEKADGRIFEGFHYLFVPRFFLTFSWTSMWPAFDGRLVGLLCWFSDWLCLDRVIDAPALQDELTWDGGIAWRSRVFRTRCQRSRTCPFRGSCLQCAKGVDWLPMAKPVSINRSRIRRDCASLLGVPVAGSPHRRLRSSFFGTRRS